MGWAWAWAVLAARLGYGQRACAGCLVTGACPSEALLGMMLCGGDGRRGQLGALSLCLMRCEVLAGRWQGLPTALGSVRKTRHFRDRMSDWQLNRWCPTRVYPSHDDRYVAVSSNGTAKLPGFKYVCAGVRSWALLMPATGNGQDRCFLEHCCVLSGSGVEVPCSWPQVGWWCWPWCLELQSLLKCWFKDQGPCFR